MKSALFYQKFQSTDYTSIFYVDLNFFRNLDVCFLIPIDWRGWKEDELIYQTYDNKIK